MSSVLIIGAGPAGAVAALCLARRGHAVTVLDKDSLPPRSLDEWQRESVQQIGQGHSLLALGTDILARECPDIVARMIDDGAHRVPLVHDPSRWNLFIRRKRFDATLRNALSTQPGARVLAGVAASGLLIRTATGGRPPHVFGVKTTAGDDITADVVVDAGGRHSTVRTWLSRQGIGLGVVDDPTTFFYLTRHYRLKAGRSFPSTRVPIVVALAYATVLAFPEDGDFFQLTIQLDGNDRTKRLLRDGATFDRFLKEVPMVSAWIDSGQPLDEPEPLGSVGNCRKYTCNGEALVTGLMLVGDAAVHTNPTAGRGIALAVAHARALADFLHADTQAESPVVATRRWEQSTSQLMEPWLKSQIEIDRDRRQQIRACLEGNEMDVSASSRSRLTNALAELHDCEVVASAADRLFNLLVTPDEIAADRDVMRRLLRASRHAKSPYLGPSRQQYERLVGAHVEPRH